jgi:hypothetical protein
MRSPHSRKCDRTAYEDPVRRARRNGGRRDAAMFRLLPMFRVFRALAERVGKCERRIGVAAGWFNRVTQTLKGAVQTIQ